MRLPLSLLLIPFPTLSPPLRLLCLAPTVAPATAPAGRAALDPNTEPDLSPTAPRTLNRAMAAAAPASDSDRTEQILSQFLQKTLHAVLSSRIPHLAAAAAAAARNPTIASGAVPRKRDRWFHIALGDLPPALEDHHFGVGVGGVVDPIVVDVVLTAPEGRLPEVVVERWTVQCDPPPAPLWGSAAAVGASPRSTDAGAGGSSSASSFRKTYKKCIILLRSIYLILRLLPAHRVFRMLCSSNQTYNYELSYRVSSFAAPFSREEEAEMKHHGFTPVETLFGNLVVVVQYRRSLVDFNFEVSALPPPTIIMDYVGSPAADPMRAFPSSLPDRGTSRPISHSLRGARSSRFDHSHSWNNAPPVHHHPLGSCPTELMFSPTDNCGFQASNQRPSRKGSLGMDEFKLSPPFSSSPTPSPPSYGINYPQNRLRHESAPMNIPMSLTGKRQVARSPNLSDPPRNLLPPPSPRSTRAADLSSQESPSEGRSFRKSDSLRMADVYSNLQISTAQKGMKDGRDDSGRFSAALSSGSPLFGFSRSSSRLSVQEDPDDGDYLYPFAVDDVDASDSQPRSIDGKEAPESASSSKSQDAAVGVLVHMLRTAAPLRQDQSSSSQSSRSQLNAEIGTSSLFMPRKASEALEELQSYKEMKNFLLCQSANK